MRLPKIPRYTRYEKLITFFVLAFLLIHSFYPKIINIDKYTIMLLAILFLIALMPSVYSAKLPYLFEIKRKIEEVSKERKRRHKAKK